MKRIKKLNRLFYGIIAFTLGYCVVYGLSKVSDNYKGPIETVLTGAGTMVQDVEKSIILEKRETSRENKLAPFKSFIENKDKIIHSKSILFGASDDSKKESYENIISLEDSLALAFQIIHIYKPWGEKEWEQFPIVELNAIHQIGSIPMITWEPWVSDFTKENFPKINNILTPEKNQMTAIANGTYDTFIEKWATEARNFGHPIYIRLGHEMNEPYRYPWGPQNNSAAEYVAGWQHVHDIFTKVGAQNIIWVWSPHPSYGNFKKYYPGDDYVDLVATGILNYGDSVNWSKWWSFSRIFGTYKQLESFKKPMMIAEFGSLATGGDRAEWFREALHDFQKNYPAVNSIVFFHYSGDTTTSNKSVSWYIKDDKKVTTAIKKELKIWPNQI